MVETVGSPRPGAAVPAEGRVPGVDFALSFLEGRGVLSLPRRPLARLADLERLDLEIPDVRFPFDMGGGVDRLRSRRCIVRRAALATDATRLGRAIADALARRPPAGFAVASPALAIDSGILRFGARVSAGDREVDFTAAAWVEGPPLPILRLIVFDARTYGFFPLPAPQIVAHLLGALGAANDPAVRPAPLLRRIGACALEIDALGLALFDLLPPAGWRLPERTTCRLDPPSLLPDRIGLGWGTAAGASGGKAPARLRGAIALHRDAQHAFAPAEAALATGDLDTATAAHRRALVAGTRPFAVQRLLQILAADERTLEEAESLARSVLDRDPDSPAALLALATAAAERGNPADAATAFEAVAAGERRDGGPFEAPAALRAAERARARMVDQGERLAERAAELLAFDRIAEALGEARRSVEIAPRSLRATFVLAEAAARAGEPAEAKAAYGRLLDANAQDWDLPLGRAEVARRLAVLHEKAGEIDEALRLLGVSLDAGPTARAATQAWQRVADLHSRRGDARATAESLLAAAGDDRTDESDRDRAAHLVAAAEIQRKRLGDPGAAAPLLQRAVELDPHAEGALDALEAIAVEGQDWARAADVVGRKIEAAARRPGEQKALIARLAWIAGSHLRDPDRSAALYRKALEIDPAFVPALLALARHAWQAGDRIEALRRYNRLLEPDAGATAPEREEAHLRLGAGESEAGRTDEAVRHIESAVAAMPRSTNALDRLCEVLAAAGRPAAEAEAVRRRAEIEQSSATRRDLWFRRGRILETLGERKSAVHAYRQALRASPYDAPALMRLCDIHRAEGQPAELGKALERLIEVHETRRSPDLEAVDPADLYYELASLARNRLADPRRAEIYLLRLLVKRPDSAAALEQLTDLLVRRGALEEADRMFARRLAMAPNGEAATRLVTERARARLLAPNGEAAALELLLDLDGDQAPDDALALRSDLRAKRGEVAGAARDLRVLLRRATAAAQTQRIADTRTRLFAVLTAPEADAPQAREVLGEILAADPFDAEAAMALAEIEARLPEPAARVEALARLLDRAPGLPPEHRARLCRLLGDAASEAGDPAGAEQALARAVKIDPDPVRRADHQVAHARVVAALGDEETAMAELEDALAASVDHPIALALLADRAYREQEWEHARGLYARLHRVDGGEPLITREEREFRRAELAEMFGDEIEAEACYRAIAAANPRHVDSREALAQVAVYREDWGEAARLLEEVLRLLPVDALERLSDVRHRLGEIYARLGDLGSARHNLELVVAQDGSRLAALELLTEIYERLHLWPEAAEAFARLARVHAAPGERARAIYRQAEIARLRLGDEAAAADLYLKASDLDPHHGPTLVRLAEIYFAQGDFAALADVVTDLPDDAETGPDVDLTARAAAAAAVGGRDPAALVARLRRTGRPDAGVAARALADLARRMTGDAAALDRAVAALLGWGDPLSGEALGAALGTMIAADLADTGAIRTLARLQHPAGRVPRTRVLLSLLCFLDPEDPASERLAALGNARAAPAAALDPLGPVVHPGCMGPLRRALCSAARAGIGFDPAPVVAGSRIDKLPALSATLSSVARRLGAPAWQAVTCPGGAEITVEPTRPPTLVVGAAAMSLPQAEFVFLAARALEEVRSGTTAIVRVPADQIDALLARFGDRLPDAAADVAAARAQPPAPADYLGACRHTANRVGLLACTMPLAALRALARLEGWHDEIEGERGTREILVRRSAAMRELVEYALGGDYDAAVEPP